MATLTVQTIPVSGGAPTYDAADVAGDEFPWAEDIVVHIKNGSGSAKTVTLNAQEACNQGALHNSDVVVDATDEIFISGIEERFADVDGNVQLTYSAVTSVTIAVLT